ncbi:MAG: YqaA family protein [Hyphomicrobiales bacterium]
MAATILPAQSELVLSSLIAADSSRVVILVVIASVGNITGSVINWILGRGIESFKDKRWFPVRPLMLERSKAWYYKYGRWSLLLSWAPVVGDPLTVVAGVLREPFWRFLLLVSIAKIGRYIVLATLVLWAIAANT